MGAPGSGLVITQKLVQQMGARSASNPNSARVGFLVPPGSGCLTLPQSERLPLDRIQGKRVWLLEPDPFTHASLLALLGEWHLDVHSPDGGRGEGPR